MIAWTAIRALLGRVPMLAWLLAAALAWGAYQRHQVTVEHAGKLKIQKELAVKKGLATLAPAKEDAVKTIFTVTVK